MPPGELVDAVQSAHPKLQVWYMEYPHEAGHTALLAAVPRNDPATGKPFDERNQVFYLDPVNAEQTGQRYWGECCFQRENFVPFILEFHYNLTLPGNWGLWLMGLVAIAWVIDCFVALWLTLPRGKPFSHLLLLHLKVRQVAVTLVSLVPRRRAGSHRREVAAVALARLVARGRVDRRTAVAAPQPLMRTRLLPHPAVAHARRRLAPRSA